MTSKRVAVSKTKTRRRAIANPLAYLDDRLSVAIHEAGHAVAFHVLLGKASAVRIRPWKEGSRRGRIPYEGWTDYPHTERDYKALAWRLRDGSPRSNVAQHARRLRQADMIVSTAGYAAQAIHWRKLLVFGSDEKSNVDAKHRRQDIRVLLALGDVRCPAEIVCDAEMRTFKVLREHWPEVMKVAVALEAKLDLSAKEVQELMA